MISGFVDAQRLERPVGGSSAWLEVLGGVERFAGRDVPVLIRGEWGTGRCTVAAEIHRRSIRRGAAFGVARCDHGKNDPVLAALFGGGSLEGGSVFFREIEALPADYQGRLFDLLVSRERGVRLFFSTTRNLADESLSGAFRDDLFMRMNSHVLKVPPLRDRREDIEPLLRHFMLLEGRRQGKSFSRIDSAGLSACLDFSWPGNVRELEIVVERSVMHFPGPLLHPDPGTDPSIGGGSSDRSLDGVLRRHLIRVLRATGGRIYGDRGAARILGLKPSTLQARLKKLGIDRKNPR